MPKPLGTPTQSIQTNLPAEHLPTPGRSTRLRPTPTQPPHDETLPGPGVCLPHEYPQLWPSVGWYITPTATAAKAQTPLLEPANTLQQTAPATTGLSRSPRQPCGRGGAAQRRRPRRPQPQQQQEKEDSRSNPQGRTPYTSNRLHRSDSRKPVFARTVGLERTGESRGGGRGGVDGYHGLQVCLKDLLSQFVPSPLLPALVT